MNTMTLLLLTALGPISWGSTYLVTSEFLPAGMPFTAAVIRCLPAGLILIAISRYWPEKQDWLRLLLLSALNIGCFQALLFIAAYRLPGGLAAVISSVQPLILLILVWIFQKQAPGKLATLTCLSMIGGMALLILAPLMRSEAGFALDTVGLVAASLGAVSMALGVYLAKYGAESDKQQNAELSMKTPQIQKEIPLLAFTGWQLTLGGLMLLPLSLLLEPALPTLHTEQLVAYSYLSLAGTLLAYLLWFRGIRALPPVLASTLGILSPLTAVTLGWIFLDQKIEGWGFVGLLLVIISILVLQLSPYLTQNQNQAQ